MDLAKFFPKKNVEINEKQEEQKTNYNKFLIKLDTLYNNKKLELNLYEKLRTYAKQNFISITVMKKLIKAIKGMKIIQALKIVIPSLIENKDEIENLANTLIVQPNKTWTKDHKHAIKDILYFIYNPKETSYGLYGSAGTGKSTMIMEVVSFLKKKNLIKNVALTAPTNKATNILRSKGQNMLAENSKDLDFITVHKLLQYENDFNTLGERIFVKNKKSIIHRFQLTVVDECSMISEEVLKHVFTDIEIAQKEGHFPKIIFSGDPAQLPPVSEKTSPLFMSAKSKLCPKRSMILSQIIRTDNENIIGICNKIRSWIADPKSEPDISMYKNVNGVKFYYKKNIKKEDSKWLKNFMSEKYLYNSIILTWTNKQSNSYNDNVRKTLLKKDKLDKFEVGDKLIINDFYKLPEVSDTSNKQKFYTSEQIKVEHISIINHNIARFMPVFPAKKNRIKNSIILEHKFRHCINTINKNTKRTYKVWRLTVSRLYDTGSHANHDNANTNDNKKENETKLPKTYSIFVIHNNSLIQLDNEKKYVQDQIRKLSLNYQKDHRESMKRIEKHIIKPLWKEWNKVFVEFFANVDYGHSISSHKAQGSTYFNVFVDVDDILKNYNDDEAKRSLYTSLSRASNEIHLLF
jgi:hypothetical protein